MDRSDKITNSWMVNAGNWIAVIDNAEIESRRLCTNQAIIDTILSHPLQTILDIGCGEGWLTRTLRANGKQSYGVDVVPALVNNAKTKDGDFYSVASYKELAAGIALSLPFFDAAVMNFSLLDRDDTDSLVQALHRYVQAEGFVFIQTLHPAAVNYDEESHWRSGSWDGLSNRFTDAYDWYYRNLPRWLYLFNLAGLDLVALKEPLHPQTQKPLSFIFVLQVKKVKPALPDAV